MGSLPVSRRTNHRFLSVPKKGFFKCFGCQKSGSVIDFVKDVEKISYDDSLRLLARCYGIAVIVTDQLPVNNENATAVGTTRKIFLVHGHNEEIKWSVVRTLEQLGFDAVVLHEYPNSGRNILQKFEDYSNVGFAIVLLTADDKGFACREGDSHIRLRARQNVIFELGFFIAKLGSSKVMALIDGNAPVEKPSDYDGVLYTEYDSRGSWKMELVRELHAAGLDVDANRLIKK